MIHGGGGDVLIFLPLAQTMTLDRPVFGLQAIGYDGSQTRHTTVEEMAAHYAAEILAYDPFGPYHLLGYSAGGWYAYAVATELQQQGGTIGFLGVVDTEDTANIHRLVRAPLVALHILRRVPMRSYQLLQTHPQELRAFFLERYQAMRFHFLAVTQGRSARMHHEKAQDMTFNPTLHHHSDYYIQAHFLYSPSRTSLMVDVFSTHFSKIRKLLIWRFYALKGVTIHSVFERHTDFYNHEIMPMLVEILNRRLWEIENH